MKRTKIAAIDVGTTKVCTIMADADDAGVRVLGVGVAPSAGLQKGMVVNSDDAKEAIRDSVRNAERTAGYKLESAYIGVTGRHVSSVNNKGVIAITRNDQLVKKADLKRVLQVARTVKIPAEHKLLHVIPRSYAVDGQEGVKNPVGMHGFRLDVEAHIITGAVSSIQNLTKCIHGLGIEIDDMVLEPLASAESVLSEEEKQSGVMLADIGGGTTDIVVFKDDTVYHTSILPVAGQSITRDIQVGMGLSYELAEEMKKKYGNVTPLEGNAKPVDDRNLTEDGHSVSYRDLSEVIRIRVDELLRLMLLELPNTDINRLIPAGIVLTGGTSNLPGIAEMAMDLTRMPVRVGVPANLYGVSDELRDPAHATGVGLLLWKQKNKSVEGLKPAETGVRKVVSRLFRFIR